MSRTNRKFPYKLPAFIHLLSSKEYHQDGFSSKRSPDREWKKTHNRLLRKKQKRKLRSGKEFLLNRKSHVWNWW